MPGTPRHLKDTITGIVCATLSAPSALNVKVRLKQVSRSACDEELVLAVQNTLADDSASLNMAELNDTYVMILKRYSVQITESRNYRKYLKQLLSERLPNLQFVKSLRKSEPDKIVLPAAVSKAVDVLSGQMDS